MTSPIFVTDQDILSKISPADAVVITKQAFSDYEANKNKMPEKIYLNLSDYKGDFRAMPAYVSRYDIAGIKWVNSHKDNPKLGLPSVMATLLINNPKTGELIAIMQATAITCLRTGAVGAIATDLLIHKDEISIALIGCGKQAEYQVKCIHKVKSIKQITLYDITKIQAENLAKDSVNASNSIVVCETIQEACKTADIIITSTPGKIPILQADDIPEKCLIIAIGADANGKQELDHDILLNATVIVDDIKQATHSGELNTAITQNKLKEDDINATLGELLMGKEIPYKNRVIVDSTGLAIQDLALAGFYLNLI